MFLGKILIKDYHLKKRLSNRIKSGVFDFLSLIYPNYCLACSGSLVKGEDLLCSLCLLEMPKTEYHKMAVNPLWERLQLRMPLKHAFAYYHFSKGGKVQELLHTFKYKGRAEIGHRIGKVFAIELKEAGYSDQFDCIVPVPLHTSRKRARGYNQSEEFARGLASELALPCTDSFVKRAVKTQTQTRKSKLNRWKNVSEVFEIKNEVEVRNKRILLVDDVVTTGATLEACSIPLLKAGCAELSIACMAAAQK
jgi:ComF family protein